MPVSLLFFITMIAEGQPNKQALLASTKLRSNSTVNPITF